MLVKVNNIKSKFHGRVLTRIGYYSVGDSGGPIQYIGIVANKPKMVQFGIVSYGVKSCGGEIKFNFSAIYMSFNS